MTTRERDRLRRVRENEHAEARLYHEWHRSFRATAFASAMFLIAAVCCWQIGVGWGGWALVGAVAGIWACDGILAVRCRVRCGVWPWNPTGRG